ncbi:MULTISPECIES: hypothetical protein [Acinetobacter]|uniref:Uncharacterized protein n=1 Tax=Acinetobacter higginsii TaxID=70347 RepID=N9TCH3_9GAMM|nr:MULTISPECIES: hypothetical protein [Acinetobacter]ENX55059.1 hypothetical protein F902_03669 [Acinetobacter higginsii]ENX61312.1 hypothetical protein F885_01712 [Acinetobacter higginsii]MCH7318789.1 pilus assembly protein FilA [Acinetobacter higginsii]MCH7338084.1 pilus assembly protein FilA [Acinetobacter higginsii]
MVKNKKIGCLSLLLLSPLTMAMQPLDDQSLSSTIGQNGLNIGVQVSKVDFNQISIIDRDGFAKKGETALPKAALVVAASSGGATPGIDFVQTFNANGTIQNNTSELLNAIIDADRGTGTKGAFANIAVAFGNNVNGIRIRPLSVYLVPDDPVNIDALSSLNGSSYVRKSIFSSGTTLKQNIKELLRTSNIDIEFIANNKPNMNIQLGAAPQGHMIMFGGALKSICGSTTANPDGCNINLVSGTTGAKFDLQMTGKDVNGFSLNGFYAGIENQAINGSTTIPGGVVFGNTGTSDKFNLSLNNVKMGDTIPAANLDVNTFNGLQNGSMGNWGIKGASITDFKMKVSGM